MEQSAFEAIMIGVNVFVFIAALTAGVLLMTNIIDMVNFANDNAVVGMNGTLAESVGNVNERIYTGAELLSYYRKEQTGLNFLVSSELSKEIPLTTFIKEVSVSNYLNKRFMLQYKGDIEGKETYVFVMQ